MNAETKKIFNKRAFVSVAMLITGLLLPVSGIMNHNLQFDELTMQRHFWMSVHNVSALLFTIFMVIHIAINRKPLFNYVKRINGLLFSKETIYAFLVIMIIVGMFSMHALHSR